METVRIHNPKKKDRDTFERNIWKGVNNVILRISKPTDSIDFLNGLKVGLYHSYHQGKQWASGNGSEFAQETRERLGLNLHQYNLCCQAIFQHKYNDDYRDLCFQKKTRDEIIKDLTSIYHPVRYDYIKFILDYYDKYR